MTKSKRSHKAFFWLTSAPVKHLSSQMRHFYVANGQCIVLTRGARQSLLAIRQDFRFQSFILQHICNQLRHSRFVL